MDFYKKTVYTLTDEAKHRGLKSVEQISHFVNQAITFKYGKNDKINVSTIIAEVYQNLHMGTKDLPDLPDELKKPDLNSPEIQAKITEVATELARKYRADGTQPKLDQIQIAAKVALGLTDDTGKILRSSDDVSNTQLAKITTITANVLDQNLPNPFSDDTKDGLRPIYDAVNKQINPE